MMSLTPLPILLPAIALFLAACSSGANPSNRPGTPAPPGQPSSSPAGAAAQPAQGEGSLPPGQTTVPATSPSGPLSPPVKVRMAMLAAVSDGGIFLAAERGYFREEGIEVEFTVIDSAGRMIPLLATGQLDIGTGGLNVALINAVQQGVPMKIVADKGSLQPGFGYEQLVVRKDLVDAGAVAAVADLKGKTVAVNSASSIDIVLLVDLLRPVGLTPDDVYVVEIPFPDMVAAL